MNQRLTTVILLASLLAVAQTGPQNSDRRKTEAQHLIAELHAKLSVINQPTSRDAELRAACSKNCSDAKLLAEMADLRAQRLRASNQVVMQIHQVVDAYVIDPANGDLGESEGNHLVHDLKQILGEAEATEPAAFLLDSPHGRALVLFYAIEAGGGASSTTLRAYQKSGNRLHLADVTGSDLDSYGNLWVKRLNASEPPRELWLLLGGQAFGANGPNIRMRIYSFKGERFATKWMPANVWGTFTVSLTREGFRVDGPYYQEDRERHDHYLVSPDGVYLCGPRECQ